MGYQGFCGFGPWLGAGLSIIRKLPVHQMTMQMTPVCGTVTHCGVAYVRLTNAEPTLQRPIPLRRSLILHHLLRTLRCRNEKDFAQLLDVLRFLDLLRKRLCLECTILFLDLLRERIHPDDMCHEL